MIDMQPGLAVATCDKCNEVIGAFYTKSDAEEIVALVGAVKEVCCGYMKVSRIHLCGPCAKIACKK